MSENKLNEKEREKKENRKRTALAADDTTGQCLSLNRAGAIVQSCSNGPHDIDLTLEEVGLITANQRLVFRECVFNGVLGNGCNIDRGDIPNDGDTTLREVRNAIKAAAS
jgi:hypothetical protein